MSFLQTTGCDRFRQLAALVSARARPYTDFYPGNKPARNLKGGFATNPLQWLDLEYAQSWLYVRHERSETINANPRIPRDETLEIQKVPHSLNDYNAYRQSLLDL